MGKKKMESTALVKELEQALESWSQEEERQIITPRGRTHVRRDEKGSATALGQLGFLQNFWRKQGCSSGG